MKKLFLLSSLLLSVGCSALLNPYRTTIDHQGNRFTSESLELRFDVPAVWQIYSYHSRDSIESAIFKQDDQFKDDQFRALCELRDSDKRAITRVTVSQNPYNLHNYLTDFTSSVKSKKIVSADWIVNGNDSAVQIDFTLVNKSVFTYYYRDFIFIRNNHLVRIRCRAKATLFPEYEPALNDVLQSISFSDTVSNNVLSPWAAGRDVLVKPIDFIAADTSNSFISSYDSICADSDKSFLWKVTSSSNTVYILGSIHVGTPEMYPMKPVITEAFDASEVLVVEVDSKSRDSKNDINKYARKMVYPAGESLNDHISDTLNKKLKEVCNQVKFVSLVNYTRYQPWILGMTLEMLKYQQLGVTDKYGIDNYFLNKSIKRKMTLEELETAGSQLELLYTQCNSPQFLNYVLNDISNLEASIVPLIGSWKCGNTEFMEKLCITEPMEMHPEFSEFYEKLLFERNRHFVDKIVGYLQDSRTYFVVFGSAHALGEKGVIALLKSKGYDVEQL